MPYTAIDDIPKSIRNRLPIHGLEIYRSAFNNAWKSYARYGTQKREEIAHRVAWAAVKHKYRKSNEQWVER
jgi:cation transport regulator